MSSHPESIYVTLSSDQRTGCDWSEAVQGLCLTTGVKLHGTLLMFSAIPSFVYAIVILVVTNKPKLVAGKNVGAKRKKRTSLKTMPQQGIRVLASKHVATRNKSTS